VKLFTLIVIPTGVMHVRVYHTAQQASFIDLPVAP
jgi:uncharacterized protein YqiB (DUF1249 family)